MVLVLDSGGGIRLRLTLVSADQLLSSLASFGLPNSDSPIVGASEEDRVLEIVPERIATHLVDGSSMAMVHFHVLLGVRSLALQDGAVFSSSEVGHSLTIGEINGQTSSVNERHGSILLFHVGSSIHILVVGVGLAF